jgi:hypothetical protein
MRLQATTTGKRAQSDPGITLSRVQGADRPDGSQGSGWDVEVRRPKREGGRLDLVASRVVRTLAEATVWARAYWRPVWLWRYIAATPEGSDARRLFPSAMQGDRSAFRELLDSLREADQGIDRVGLFEWACSDEVFTLPLAWCKRRREGPQAWDIVDDRVPVIAPRARAGDRVGARHDGPRDWTCLRKLLEQRGLQMAWVGHGIFTLPPTCTPEVLSEMEGLAASGCSAVVGMLEDLLLDHGLSRSLAWRLQRACRRLPDRPKRPPAWCRLDDFCLELLWFAKEQQDGRARLAVPAQGEDETTFADLYEAVRYLEAFGLVATVFFPARGFLSSRLTAAGLSLAPDACAPALVHAAACGPVRAGRRRRAKGVTRRAS